MPREDKKRALAHREYKRQSDAAHNDHNTAKKRRFVKDVFENYQRIFKKVRTNDFIETTYKMDWMIIRHVDGDLEFLKTCLKEE